MPSGIGKRLSDARKARGIELADAEERLKIRPRYLQAMEEERWDLLPGAAYGRSFLRAYADFLGLDGADLVDEYRELHAPQKAGPGAEHVRQIPTRKQQPGLRAPGPAPGRPSRWRIVGAISIAAVIGTLLVLGITQGSDGGGGGQPAARSEPAPTTSPTETSPGAATTQTAAEPPRRVTLRLTTTGTVWVCLVDDEGQPVIEGVTVPAGEEPGPFRARAFEVTFGNGAVQMEANGDRVPIPSAAEPLGYRVTPEKTSELPAASRPTCT